MRYVMKFGGSFMKEAGYGAICNIISHYKDDSVVVVVSALRGVTDDLIDIVSQSISETNVSVVIKRNFLEKAQEVLYKDVIRGGEKLEAEPDISVIAAVGEGMKGTPRRCRQDVQSGS
ncbi:MAG: amino acid kinase family protein [Thermoproteota archaeon]